MSEVAYKTPELTTFYVYLTSGCNCACLHCYFVPGDLSSGTSGAFLTHDCLRHAITQALPLGLRHLKWSGGEPTLHPEFQSFLRLQQEFGLSATIETNGLLINQPLANLMAECGVTDVAVSLDGATAETHETIRGVHGGFAKTVAGIRALSSAGFSPELILTLQKDNVDELDDFLALCAELGAGSVKFNVVQPLMGGESLNEAGRSLAVEEVIQIAQEFNDGRVGKYGLPLIIDVPWAFRPLSKIISGEQDGGCNLMHILGILPGGDYALCGVGQQNPELTLGAVMDDSLAKIWQDHPVLQRMRKGLPDELQGVCARCLMKTVCRGSCVAINYQVGGDLFSSNWFCQQAMDAGIFPVSRLAKNR